MSILAINNGFEVIVIYTTVTRLLYFWTSNKRNSQLRDKYHSTISRYHTTYVKPLQDAKQNVCQIHSAAVRLIIQFCSSSLDCTTRICLIGRWPVNMRKHGQLHDSFMTQLDHWRIFKVNTFTEGVSKFILGSHNPIHSLINCHRVRFLPVIIEHVRVDPVVVSEGQLGWIVLEAGHHHVTTDRLALGRQELDLRGVAFASDGVALAVVVSGKEVEGWKDGDLIFRLGLHELLMNRVEEVRTCGVQVVPEIPPSVLFQVIDGQLEEGMPSAAGYEPVEYVDLRLFSDDEGMLVRLLADQTVIVHSPVVQRFEGVHVKVEVDPTVSMEHKVSHDVRSEDGCGVAVVKDQVAWIVTRHELTDVIQRPEPVLPVGVQRLPGLHPFLVSVRNLIRVPNLSSQKKKN